MKPRHFYLAAWLIVAAMLAYACTGCASAPTHNQQGGYIDACGQEPGLIGDDC